MNTHAQSLDFYDFCYPDSFKPPRDKEHQHVFTDHGCMEACNLEYNDTFQGIQFMPKKQKCRSYIDEENYFFSAIQPVLPLGKPGILTTIFSSLTFTDLYTEKSTVCKQKRYKAKIEKQFENLAYDHPDVFHGSFLKLMAKNFGEKNNFDSKEQRKLFSQISPHALDIPREILNKFLVEEITLQSDTLEYDQDYAGGCLSYQPISSRNGFEYGFTVGAQGDTMSELSIQLLCTSTRNRKNENISTDQEITFPVSVSTSSQYKSVLSSRLLQVETSLSSNNSDIVFVGCRSGYNAHVFSLNKNEISKSEDNPTSLKFQSDSAVQQLGSSKSNSFLTSLCLNPYIDGQCSIATSSGSVYLWDASVQNDAFLHDVKNSSLQRICISSNYSPKWLQLEHTSHPRQLFIADRYNVNVIDCRVKSNRFLRILHNLDPIADEQIMTIKSSNNFAGYFSQSSHNSFQCWVATQSSLSLFDQRHCKLPILKWSLNMSRPCQHLASTFLPHQNGNLIEGSSLIVAANQVPQEIHCYQYRNYNGCVNKNSFTEARTTLPPVSISAVKSLGGFKDMKNAIKSDPSQLLNSHVLNRISQPLVGLAAYNYQASASEAGVMVLQASSCGDILYQALSLSHVEDQDREFSPQPETNFYSNIADEKYLTWANKVAKGFNQKSFVKLRNNAHKLDTFQCSVRKLNTKLSIKLKNVISTKDCKMCSDMCQQPVAEFVEGLIRTVERSSSKNKKSSDSDLTQSEYMTSDEDVPLGQKSLSADKQRSTCPNCGVDFYYSNQLLDSMESRRPLSRNMVERNMTIWSEDIFKDDLPVEVPPLCLINTSKPQCELGKILTSTWDGSYKEAWEGLEEEKLSQKEANVIRTAHAILDILPHAETVKH